MSNVFDLDAIREAADRKYGSTTFTVDGLNVELINPMQMSKAKRKELIETQALLGSDDDSDDENATENDVEDQEAILRDIIAIAASDAASGERLLNAIPEGNLAVLMEVFERYMDGTELGEASASAS